MLQRLEGNVPINSLAIDAGRGSRRSTRIDRAIQLTVAGVDTCRGPYNDEVSTITLNCHGCKYESKREVFPDAFVIVQLNGKSGNSQPISTRGHVKWIKRPTVVGGLFQTAIELDEPGNIWGIDSPPSDWLPFCGPRSPEADAKSKTVAVLRPDAAPTATSTTASKTAPATTKEEAYRKAMSPRAAESAPASATSSSLANQPASQLIGGFQQQMEKMMLEAAEAVVRERAATLMDEQRAQLREEAKRVVSEAASSRSGSWIDESLKQMNQMGEESARARHTQWTKKIEADLQQALKKMEMRQREIEEVSDRLTTKAQEKMQGFLETSRKEAVDRIIARLKEQSAPVIEHAQKIAADLVKREEELEKICDQWVEKSAVQIEESCTRLDKQFEMILRERLDSARAEFERAANVAAKAALASVRASSAQQEAEAQARLRSALEPVTESALAGLKEKAAGISREFAGEISNYSRSHLEFVSGAISELAKGIGKLSKS
jgi:hypothetical protein